MVDKKTYYMIKVVGEDKYYSNYSVSYATYIFVRSPRFANKLPSEDVAQSIKANIYRDEGVETEIETYKI